MNKELKTLKKTMNLSKLILAIFFIFSISVQNSFAACSGTTTTWDGSQGDDDWSDAANWDTNNIPNTSSEDVIITSTAQSPVFGDNYTVGCITVNSGTLEGGAGKTLTITGESFSAPNSNSILVTNNNDKFVFNSTSNQSFTAVDELRSIDISNTAEVRFYGDVKVKRDFTITVSTGTLYIEGNARFDKDFTVPAGYQVVVKKPNIVTMRGNLIVNGTFTVEAGAKVIMRGNKSVSVGSSGIFKLDGAAGDPAKIVSEDLGKYFDIDVAGSFYADNFVVSGLTATGINITGTLSKFDNGEIRGLVGGAGAYAMTWGAAAVIPTTMDTIGFYDDFGTGATLSIDASAYNLTATTISNYSGDVVGDASDDDPNGKITWTTPAVTVLTIAEIGKGPGFEIAANRTKTWGEWAFSLSQSDTITNITEIVLTMSGTASMADIDFVRVYKDDGDCKEEIGGADTQIGADLSFSGSPLKATVTIASGDLSSNGPSDRGCFWIEAATSANPSDGKTIKFCAVATADITNSQGYGYSEISGPEFCTQQSIIKNANFTTWSGATDSLWNDDNNWSNNAPDATMECYIGSGTNIAQVNVDPVICNNAYLQSGGTIDWNSSTRSFDIYGALEIQAGFTFDNSTAGIITMKGNSNQSFEILTNFPGDLYISNTGGAGSDIVSTTGDASIGGDIYCTSGVLNITAGTTLTVLGDITIQTGCTLDIDPDATLVMSNGKILTIDLGGTLNIVGDASADATITGASATDAYTVDINGTVAARYYVFSRLNTNGVDVDAGATIDSTNHFQDGSFLYPINNSSTLLKLHLQVPTNSMDNMVFSLSGSPATGTTNIDTTNAGAGTLSITGYSGDIAGATYDTDPVYNISWTGQANTIKVTTESSAPSTVTVGNTYVIGRFGFQQTEAGASFSDTDITSLKLTFTGTGSATGDISALRLYYDDDCDSTGGTEIGSGVYSGSPKAITFSLAASDLTVPADLTSPTKVCAYVEYDIDNGAGDGNTVGTQIAASLDIVNSQSYDLDPSASAPVYSGNATIDSPATTIWTGAVDTNWHTSGNWGAGIPDSTKSCEIPNVANDPIISSGNGTCLNIVINNGIVTVNAGLDLITYGNYTNTGTLNLSATSELVLSDGGTLLNHNITEASGTISKMTITKTGNGDVIFNNASTTITNLTVTGTLFDFKVNNGKTLIFPNGATFPNGTLVMAGGSTVEIGNAQSLNFTGGNLTINGTNDSFPQSAANKGVIKASGGGTNTFSFTSTSGTQSLTGFQFDRLDDAGLNLGGSTVLSALNGGQFTNLSSNYASMYAVQINTTGSIPATSTNVAWTWGDFNSFDPATANTPANTDSYTILRSTGCGNQSMDFSEWTGDFFETQPTWDTSNKVSNTACNLSLGASTLAVSLLSFEAISYNNEIDIVWETNNESNHMGFNVFRANVDGTEFIQINPILLRNFLSAGSAKGKYRFLDKDVNNGTSYFYYIQDIQNDGKETMHGPVNAIPLSILGPAPADDIDQNSGSNTDDLDDEGTTSPSIIANPSYKDLGNGFVILSQTSTSLRIEITPPNPTFTSSAWNGSYEDVEITGYSKMTTMGSPELPERIQLIEVYDFATTASVINETTTEAILPGHNISPAPAYSIDGAGLLIPSWTPDATIYSNPISTPSEFYSIDTNLVKSGNNTYLKIKVNPLKFNPMSGDLTQATKLTIDIGLDGNAWNISQPGAGEVINPFTVSNTLRIDYQQSGVFEIEYDDLVDSFVEGPFNGASVSDLRLYYQGGIEIPLEVFSPSGNFSSGDYLRFYAPFNPTSDDLKNRVLLSTVEISKTPIPAKTIAEIEGSPTQVNNPSDLNLIYNKTYEQNLVFLDATTMKDTGDHFIWKHLVNFPGWDTLSFTANLTELDNSSDENVQVDVHLFGMADYLGDITHDLGLEINGNGFQYTQSFSDNKRVIITYYVNARDFVSGNNNIDLKILGTFAGAGQYDRVYIDKVDFSYVGNKTATNGVATFGTDIGDTALRIDSFTSNDIAIYDITSPLEPAIVKNPNILTIDGGSTYSAHFYLDHETNNEDLKKFEIVQSGNYNKPTGLSLTPGYQSSLKNLDNRANLIILGHKNLLLASKPLIDHRENQGMEVFTVTHEQVYDEFSDGLTSSNAIKSFINYALNNWELKPSYLLVLGDATQDPKDINVDGLSTSDRTATQIESHPIPMAVGLYIDYGSDNEYVSSESSHMPRIAVGRIPTNDASKLEDYIEKIINYEAGVGEPNLNRIKHITFLSDKEGAGTFEQFRKKTDTLASIPNINNNGFTTSIIDRDLLGSDSATKSAVIAEFNDSPFIISALSHGAFDRIGSNILKNTDARALTNSKFPIAIAWSCEAAASYYSDKNYISLAEDLIFNKNGGSIVTLGATTQSTPTAYAKMATAFFSSLATRSVSTGQVRIGDLFLDAKLATGSGSYEKDIVGSFTLIGDPSLQLSSKVFPPITPQIVSSGSNSASGGGGGCVMINSNKPWYIGLLEYLILYVFMFSFKWLLLRSKKDLS